MHQQQRGLGLIQVALVMAVLAAIAMAAMFSMRYERNLFAEGLAKLTGHPLPPPKGADGLPGAPAGAPAAAAAKPAPPAGVLRRCLIKGKTVYSDVDCAASNPTSTVVQVHETRGIEAPKVPKPEAAESGPPSMQDKMIEKATR